MIGPLGGDSKKLDNHIFMRNQQGYQDNSGDLSKPDVDGANKQLDAAGWTRTGDGTRTKDGKPLSIRFVIPSGVATSAQESQLVQGMLEADRRERPDPDRPDRRLLREVREHRRLRPHRVLVDRDAVPDQLVAVDLRAAQGRGDPAELRAHRLEGDRRPLRRRPRTSSTRPRRSTPRTRSTA